MKIDAIKKWKEAMIGGTRTIFAKSGFVAPVAIILKSDTTSMVIGTEFTNDADKDRFAETIKKVCKDNKVVAILFISEAYTKAVENGKDSEFINENGTLKKPVREMEGRKECIVIKFETKLFAESSMIEIVRSTGGEPMLMEEEKGGRTISGRFCDLLVNPISKN